MAKILIVEDDLQLCEMMLDWLKFAHHLVEVVNDGALGLQQLQCEFYDLAILDWELPSKNGVDIVRQIRSEGSNVPVLMLTGKSAIADKAQGLDSGADDYLTKPFHVDELSARVRALLRRASNQQSNLLSAGQVELDVVTHTVTKNGEEVHLLPKEFALLEFMMRNPNKVFSAEAIIQRVWGSDADVTEEAIRTCVKRLRKKIEGSGEAPLIQTLYGVGYKLRS